ncbi:hemoglobin-like flavoprotein [Sphingomonas sp. UYEF23]
MRYGVKIEQYAFVGDVLLDTFKHILGDRFTPATREAWEALYAKIASTMIREAYGDYGIEPK